MKSCSFIGYSSFTSKHDYDVVNYLRVFLAILAENGVTDFYADGSYGWSMCCEYSVHLLKKDHPQVKLHLVLPCPPEQQTLNWSEDQKVPYDVLLENVDSIEVVSENDNENCMTECHMRLVRDGDICVCYCDKNDSESDTAQAVRAAEESGKMILNMCFDPEKIKAYMCQRVEASSDDKLWENFMKGINGFTDDFFEGMESRTYIT